MERIVGNEDLTAETSRSFSAGADVDLLEDRVGVEVTAFRHRIDDLIDYAYLGFDPASGFVTYRTANVGRAGSHGVDTNVTLRPSPWVSAAVGYSRLEASDLETDEPLTGRSRHTVNGRVAVTLGRSGPRVDLFGRVVGRRAHADADGDGVVEDCAPVLHLWDLRVAQRFGRSLDVFLGAENLLGEQDVRYYPTAGRRVYAGVTLAVAR